MIPVRVGQIRIFESQISKNIKRYVITGKDSQTTFTIKWLGSGNTSSNWYANELITDPLDTEYDFYKQLLELK